MQGPLILCLEGSRSLLKKQCPHLAGVGSGRGRMGQAEVLSTRNLFCETAPHPPQNYSFFKNP